MGCVGHFKVFPPFLFSLRRTRAKVWERRMSSSLFNVKTYVRGLEDLCHKMYERHARGEEPDHVTELSTF